jgi:hypothetical protein
MEEIVNYRFSLVRGVSSVDIHSPCGKYVESLQELAMTSKPVESEITFEKAPIADIEQEKEFGLYANAAPFGPIAPLNTFKTSSSLSVDQRLEDVFYDKDLRSAEVSRIQRVLSMGMLGLQKNRRLVPTRWSISATDDIISTSLIKAIETFPTIDFFEVYRHIHLGNHYSVILIPEDIWSFEMQEAWYDNNGNYGVASDFENANGLDHYPSIAGAYFAGRLGITEHLSKRRHKAAALIFREIRPEYVMPVGVWQIREGIRKALKGKANEFDDFQNALSFACVNLSVSKSEWIRNSKIYNNVREQMRITDFFKKYS